MCAYDATGICPEARLYDLGLLKSTAGIEGFLSDALAAYQWALDHYRQDGTPHILSNSWGIYQEAWAPDYARDPNHPFTRKVIEVIREGMLVTFAAGNCGEVCPSSRCWADCGPGRSIWGANGHPEVITFGAANINEEWIGYSSQGPAALSDRKPDVCSISHFRGYTSSDNGTSAANPVGAGVIGLLKCAKPDLTQAEALSVLQRTARDICAPGWDANSGYGIINAKAAFEALSSPVDQLPLL
jgi:subtilisin family serine protease